MAQSSSFPPLLHTRDGNHPGWWATAASRGSWKAGSRLIYQSDSLLSQLHQLPPVREPATLFPRDAAKFFNAVGKSPRNVEALVAQAVGVRMDADHQCQCCKHGYGVFASCVIVPSLSGLIHGCANCHWARGNNKSFCNFRLEKVPPTAPIEENISTTEPIDEAPLPAPRTGIQVKGMALEKLHNAMEKELMAMKSTQHEFSAAMDHHNRRLQGIMNVHKKLLNAAATTEEEEVV
ncbi:hypothetical protein N7520_002285 [Penicillium odoratum]|uniref:uncharacterized protein n=1 Tax=Penicillium odoratum TaxID=1167516 RepID=UPI002548AEE8|nr:uncharacterized protein N7520_002285 [Penicillium odoratum]KAJ5771756.1 hypothetical protein N7520_002285 [Penicillium odoratum]